MGAVGWLWRIGHHISAAESVGFGYFFAFPLNRIAEFFWLG